MSRMSPRDTRTSPRATDWRDKANCIGADGDLFYAGEREPDAVREARAICNGCTQRTACLIAAYKEADEWGIRAGLTPRQRNAHLRKADGNIARAVADALEATAVLLRNIYDCHAAPRPDGHVLWTDSRAWINVRGTPYTVHRLAWVAHYGFESVGHVKRMCAVEGCVAKACLSDQRQRAAAARKETAA